MSLGLYLYEAYQNFIAFDMPNGWSYIFNTLGTILRPLEVAPGASALLWSPLVMPLTLNGAIGEQFLV